MKTLLELKGIHLQFDTNIVFKNLNLTINYNEITVIKTGVLDGGTSLLKICNNTLVTQYGCVIYEGLISTNIDNSKLFHTVGMQFESDGLLSMYTVKENCKLPQIFHTKIKDSVIDNNVLSVAQEFDLHYLLDKYPYQLNDVQLRLANLLRLLSSKPKVILLDEIQSGMSEQLRKGLLMKLVRYIRNNNMSMIMTITAGDMDNFSDHRLEIKNFNVSRY